MSRAKPVSSTPVAVNAYTANLVSAWLLQEGNGAWQDIVRPTNAGSILGSGASLVAGADGGSAAHFSGYNTGCIICTDPPELVIEYTFMCRFKHAGETFPNRYTLYSTNSFGFEVSPASGSTYNFMHYNASASAAVIAPGAWTTVTSRRDVAATMDYFINGVFESSRGGTGGLTFPNDYGFGGNLGIGGSSGFPFGILTGDIDYVFIWDRALSDDEIAAISADPFLAIFGAEGDDGGDDDPDPAPVDYEDPCSITDPRVHVKIETGDETLHYGVHPLRDSAANGGFKEPRVLEVGPITRSASDVSTGAWSAQTATVTLADTDRVNRARSATRTSLRNCDAEIYLASKPQQLAGGPPRILFSGKVYSDQADANLALSLQINDLIGIDYSLFSEEKMIPQRETLVDFFPNIPDASLGIGEPILGGRLAPLNPADGEGVVDCPLLGVVAIGATPTAPTGTTLADVVAALQASKDAGTLYVDWGSRIGYADALSLQDYAGAVPSDYDELAGGVGSFVGIGYSDLDALLSSSAATGGNEYVACLVAGHAISEILDGNNGQPSIWIDDAQIDPAEIGVSVWCPQIPGDTSWGSTFGSDPFIDLVSSAGDTRRFTLVLFDPGSTYGIAVAGGAKVHLDCVGLEDEGDGSGDAITGYFELYYHVLINFILQNYQTGAWLSAPQFVFADGVTLLDRVRLTSFQTASDVAALAVDGGYQGSFKIGTRTSVREVIASFNLSGGCLLAQDDYGRLIVSVLDRRRSRFLRTADGSVHRTLRDKVDILPGFTIEPRPDWQANWIAYQYAQNYNTNVYERRFGGGGDVAPVEDQDSQERDGVIKKTLAFPYLRDDATALAVANYYLDLFKNMPHIARYGRRGLCGLEDDLLRGVPITHFNGYGANGWRDQAVWILQKTFSTKTMHCEFIALDVQAQLTAELPPAPTALYLDPVALEALFDDVSGDPLYADG